MPRSYGAKEIKVALADLTFKSLIYALQSWSDFDAAQEPLVDCVIEVNVVSDTEAYVSVAGHGRKRYYSIKVQTDNTFERSKSER